MDPKRRRCSILTNQAHHRRFLYRGLNNWNSVLEPYTKTRVPFKGFLKGVYKGSIIKGFYNIGALLVRILAPNVL